MLPGTAFTQKNVGNFATSSVEGPEKTLRCRWGNSNPRIQYVRNYLAHTRISCGKFLRFSTKSEKQNVSVLYSNMVYLCRYRKFTVFYPSGQILPHLFIFFRLFYCLGTSSKKLLISCWSRAMRTLYRLICVSYPRFSILISMVTLFELSYVSPMMFSERVSFKGVVVM